MLFIFDIGDRVMSARGYHIGSPAVIMDRTSLGHIGRDRYYIKYLDFKNVSGSNVIIWVDVDEIEIDMSYYRDLKIKEILS